ncbi:MAG: prepilin-type N-terminal cleavage/methylation domain-containing protein [Candidatus Omnitrophota bacterium]
MKNKGFSLIEILVVVVVGIGLMGVTFGVFLTGRNSWSKSEAYIDLQAKTRLAMDKMVKELTSSAPSKITLSNCAGDLCSSIAFMVPVAVDGSIYNAQGEIIWGAEGWEDLPYSYFITYDNRLVKAAGDVQGACCRTGGVCEYRYEFKCASLGGSWRGPLIPCSPNPCGGGKAFRIKPFFEFLFESPLAYAQENFWVFASDIEEITFKNPHAPAAPKTIKITIRAKRKTILGEEIEVILHSTVTPKNRVVN